MIRQNFSFPVSLNFSTIRHSVKIQRYRTRYHYYLSCCLLLRSRILLKLQLLHTCSCFSISAAYLNNVRSPSSALLISYKTQDKPKLVSLLATELPSSLQHMTQNLFKKITCASTLQSLHVSYTGPQQWFHFHVSSRRDRITGSHINDKTSLYSCFVSACTVSVNDGSRSVCTCFYAKTFTISESYIHQANELVIMMM
jgi:hypothetical protein